MTHHKNPANLFKIAFTALFVTGQTIFPPLILAQEMPSRDSLVQSITQNATSQTSQINASSSSSAPSTNVTNTGNNTSTSTQSNSSSSTAVSNTNTANVNQNVDATANTGNNEASRNISIGGNAGVISTGNAAVNTTAVVSGNTNTTGIAGASGGAGGAGSVANTGNGVSVAQSQNATSTTLVNNGNATTIAQGVNAKANTGGNRADRNISIGGAAGVISTGNASVNTNMLTTANGSVTLIGGNGNGTGPGSGASIVIADTGDNSRFSTSKNTTNFIVVTNSNRAVLSQMCGGAIPADQMLIDASSCVANTGNNVADRNIGVGHDAGVITTADAVVNVLMQAQVNGNSTGISQGGGSSPLSLQVDNTGDNSQFGASQNSSDTTGVNNSNDATVSQQVNAKANTGNNRANRNISLGGNAGVIRTGNATVNTLMLAQLNGNQTQIVSPQGGGSGQGQSLDVANTGDNSQIDSRSNTVTQTSVNNFNLFTLLQNVSSLADTGMNSAVRNIGNLAGQIITGGAYTEVNLGVQANSNSTVISSSSSSSSQSSSSSSSSSQSSSSSSSSTSSSSSQSNSSSSSSNQDSSSNNSGNNSNNSNGVSSGKNDPATVTLADYRDKPKGMVLGAVSLPSTGPGSSILVMILLLMLLGAGIYVQKFDINNA